MKVMIAGLALVACVAVQAQQQDFSQVQIKTTKLSNNFYTLDGQGGTIGLLSGPGGIHISFDIDAVDPLEAPGVGTPWPGGLTYREAHLAMELLAGSGLVSSMEVAEVNPIHDHENRTGKLAEELILSALGRTIA